MKRFETSANGARRFGIAHPHELNNRIGFRGGVRK